MFFNRLLLLATVLSLGVVVPAPVNAQSFREPQLQLSQQSVPEQKRQLIKELIELTGGEQMFRNVSQITSAQMQQEINGILQSIIPESSGISEAKKQEMIKTINQDMNRIVSQYNQRLMEQLDFNKIMETVYYPLYDKYFTEEDLQAMIDFYKTPTGKKTISVMPELLVESMQRVSQIIQPQAIQIFKEIFEQEIERFNSK
ncbi:DUF2059 domain-containing protein [Planktothrix mougeotii]|uniref:DUF2059 domain-containing protein n=1 Tax=Planktothrix mougeotii LEGE 06226 TaxID=1828728 RepID=A0ABR9UGY8_9CYAN|nr:DUF2059 domain-containing protein [Planktothrix mougeotii]MBE9145730.1 DUF2059 domain-containing protein [Planktothrix mougeotii LEGE 06226]